MRGGLQERYHSSVPPFVGAVTSCVGRTCTEVEVWLFTWRARVRTHAVPLLGCLSFCFLLFMQPVPEPLFFLYPPSDGSTIFFLRSIFGFLRLLSAPPLLPLLHITISSAGAYAVWEHPHHHPRLLKAYTLYAIALFLGHTALLGLLLLSHFPATASAAVSAAVPPLYGSLVAPLDAVVAALGGGAAGSWWAAFGVATSVLFDGLLAWSAWSLSAQVTLYNSLTAGASALVAAAAVGGGGGGRAPGMLGGMGSLGGGAGGGAGPGGMLPAGGLFGGMMGGVGGGAAGRGAVGGAPQPVRPPPFSGQGRRLGDA